jgi:hypothetical protein
MSERISNEELAYFRRDMSAMDGEQVDMMLDELIERRAADLTADTAEDTAFQRGRESVEHWKRFAMPALSDEEREALAWLRTWIGGPTNGPRKGRETWTRALAALDKLLADGGE